MQNFFKQWKVRTIIGNKMLYYLVHTLFLRSNKLEQLEFKLEKKLEFRNTQEKLQKIFLCRTFFFLNQKRLRILTLCTKYFIKIKVLVLHTLNISWEDLKIKRPWIAHLITRCTKVDISCFIWLMHSCPFIVHYIGVFVIILW